MKNDANAFRPTPLQLTTELLILTDGRILVHNLTQPFAELLKELNPADEQIASRASGSNSRSTPHVSPS